jgi:hypothetical protein
MVHVLLKREALHLIQQMLLNLRWSISLPIVHFVIERSPTKGTKKLAISDIWRGHDAKQSEFT